MFYVFCYVERIVFEDVEVNDRFYMNYLNESVRFEVYLRYDRDDNFDERRSFRYDLRSESKRGIFRYSGEYEREGDDGKERSYGRYERDVYDSKERSYGRYERDWGDNRERIRGIEYGRYEREYSGEYGKRRRVYEGFRRIFGMFNFLLILYCIVDVYFGD